MFLPYAAYRFGDIPEILVYDLEDGGFDLGCGIDRLAIAVLRLHTAVIAAIDRAMIRAVLSLLGAVGPDQLAAAVRAIQDAGQKGCAVNTGLGFGFLRESFIFRLPLTKVFAGNVLPQHILSELGGLIGDDAKLFNRL